MHRTQILIDPAQYQQLKTKAMESNTSLGGLIRRLIDRYLGENKQSNSLEKFAGIIEDRTCQSTTFKKFLYRHEKKHSH